ncbi:hypothetical protein HMPREF0290_0743 [Corynebacterium efficiens YS-314]|nr:acyl-CoA dehydrogenase family protein [Corynebacterium efficiens]EEW50655.1 hypothetical protein HMPREF0290_0743 [Corynebacterium efficiens YS-314]
MSTTILDTIAENAKAVGKNEIPARYGLELLGEQNLFLHDTLTETARQLRDIAARDLSVAFSIWAHTMVIKYLKTADTDYARAVLPELELGGRPGVTGMAPAFKEAAGAGAIDLELTPVDGGFRLNGKLAWASNLDGDALIVTAGRTPEGERLLIAFDGGADGVGLGRPFGLLGLNATSSSWVTLDDVFIPEPQVLSRDFMEFINAVRPTFMTLQISECLGVADAAIDVASTRLTGINEVLTDDVAAVRGRVTDLIATQERYSTTIDEGGTVPRVNMLELRLAAAEVATAATALEVRVAGGAGYAQSSPASRRFREAAFIPVQSPSETQLKWELGRARAQKEN